MQNGDCTETLARVLTDLTLMTERQSVTTKNIDSLSNSVIELVKHMNIQVSRDKEDQKYLSKQMDIIAEVNKLRAESQLEDYRIAKLEKIVFGVVGLILLSVTSAIIMQVIGK